MSHMIYVFGNDDRQIEFFKLLSQRGYNVIHSNKLPYTTDRDITISEYWADTPEIIILPVPLSKEMSDSMAPFIHSGTVLIGGALPEDMRQLCKQENVTCINYMEIPEIMIFNSSVTAEGAICTAMTNSTIAIDSSHCLVIGYGKCGKSIAEKLRGLNADTDILTILPADQKQAFNNNLGIFSGDWHKYDFIFNTAPAPVITQDVIPTLNPQVIILDIASSPGGTDFEYCKKYDIKALHLPGIPAKYAPVSSAKNIFSALNKYIDKIIM